MDKTMDTPFSECPLFCIFLNYSVVTVTIPTYLRTTVCLQRTTLATQSFPRSRSIYIEDSVQFIGIIYIFIIWIRVFYWELKHSY